jgi:hypothetical protein
MFSSNTAHPDITRAAIDVEFPKKELTTTEKLKDKAGFIKTLREIRQTPEVHRAE